ncbi:calcium homeostasis modulator protein 4-like [Carassius carassius]|uniref:calcium homeostasis modulator protein 4-like n=1 Tax=Carassius carassius TaxID=217509 RepID=UPI0028696EC8|nr:calcium homeostasis modulator protein 4-like [Carassius carassius]
MSKEWTARLKNQLKKSPFYSNAIIGFLMLGLEKLVEMDFACPCKPVMNLVFSIAYFLVPALFSSSLMFYIHSPQCKAQYKLSTLTCIIPAVVWIMLLFFDGQYFACAKTSWAGLTVKTDISASTTWCQPLTDSNNVTEKQMVFFGFRNTSQFVGLGFLLVISVILFIIGCMRCCHQTAGTKEPEAEQVEMEDPGQSSARPRERSALMEEECSASSAQL